jgi:hypothetical protein
MYKTLTLLKMKLGSLQDLDSSDYHNTFGIGLQLIKPKKLMKQRNGKNTQIWNIAGFFFFSQGDEQDKNQGKIWKTKHREA